MAAVIVTVKPDGTATVEADGWQGPTCATVTEPYRRALGKPTEEQLKAEFFSETQQQQEAKN